MPVVASAFAPTPEQIGWATRILALVTEGVAVVEGAMVDRPVILKTRASE